MLDKSVSVSYNSDVTKKESGFMIINKEDYEVLSSLDFYVRRLVANVIDYIIIYVFYMLLSVIYFFLRSYSLPFRLMYVAFAMLLTILFSLLKDGCGGRFLGKYLMGLIVVSDVTHKPIGFLGSFVRNICVVVVFTAVIAFFQMHKSKRIGDGVAGTSVIYIGKRKTVSDIIINSNE